MLKCSLDPVNLLQKIIEISRFKSLFILGAGVSYSYIKPRYDLMNDAKEELMKVFSYPLVNDEYDITEEEKIRLQLTGSKFIKNNPADGKLIIDNNNMQDYLERMIHANPQFIEYICAKNYTLDEYPEFCPEYQIFNYVNSTSIIINLNHDNLAEFFVKKLNVITLHGTITPKQKKIIMKYLSFSLDLDLRKYFFKDLYFATRESESLLTKRDGYRLFSDILKVNKFKNIVIVGYSFFKKNFYEIYDVVTYDLIREYLQKNKAQVIIIDPFPNDAANILCRELSSLDIKCYPVYWNSFVWAYYKTIEFKRTTSQSLSLIDLKRFIVFYDYYVQNNCMDAKNNHFLEQLREKSFDW